MFAMSVTTGTCIEDGKFEEVRYKIVGAEDVKIEEWDGYSEYSCENEDYQDWTVWLLTSEKPFSAIVTTVSGGATFSEKKDSEYTDNLDTFC